VNDEKEGRIGRRGGIARIGIEGEDDPLADAADAPNDLSLKGVDRRIDRAQNEGAMECEALEAALQRLCLQHGIALPTSFALVGKTLSQAESIARSLDPTLDPVDLLRTEGWTVMAQEAQSRLEPNQLLAFGFTQLQPLLRMPRRIAQLVQKAETGSLRIGIVPTQLGELEQLIRSATNRVGAALIISALLVASALMARVNHTFSVVGFLIAAAMGLYMLWRIVRTPGGL